MLQRRLKTNTAAVSASSCLRLARARTDDVRGCRLNRSCEELSEFDDTQAASAKLLNELLTGTAGEMKGGEHSVHRVLLVKRRGAENVESMLIGQLGGRVSAPS